MKKNLLYLLVFATHFLSPAKTKAAFLVNAFEPAKYNSITLLSFSGNKNNKNSLLEWKTANEIGFSHFELERSNDGKNYSTIAIVFSGATEYSFKDAGVFKKRKLVSYRLKLIDDKGKFIYSNIITVPQ